MSTPAPVGSHQVAPGWRARDLTFEDVLPTLPRFETLYERRGPDECWPWRLRPNSQHGYGAMRIGGRRSVLAHRVAWVAANRLPLTNALTVDHTCVNPLCMNPAHLEAVTLHENVRRRNERLGLPHSMTPEERIARRRERTRLNVRRYRQRQREQAAV